MSKRSICPCCNKLLTDRTILLHRTHGPSLDDRISAYVQDIDRKPFPKRQRHHETTQTREESCTLIETSSLSQVKFQPSPLCEPREHTCIPVDPLKEQCSILPENWEFVSVTSNTSCHGTPNDSFESDSDSGPPDHEDINSYADEVTQMLEECELEFRSKQLCELNPETTASSLNEHDLSNIRMFSIRIEAVLSRHAMNLLHKYFGDKLQLETAYYMEKHITALAGIKPEFYDCCRNSCVAYTGTFSKLSSCPRCHQPRFRPDKKPYSNFQYLPLIPRLQSYYGNPDMIANLSYRITRETTSGEYTDIFDGSLYRDLLNTPVSVDGTEFRFKLFEHDTDIALGLLGDGVRVFKHGSQSMWPFILINYSLPPEIRYRLPYIIPLLLVPGPHMPKNHNSFLFPFHQEMIRLAHGVPTFHTVRKKEFLLHAYLITKLADMQAFKANQYIKGPNGFSPCRACRFQGCRNPDLKRSNYYYPLKPPRGSVGFEKSIPQQCDPRNLPMRTSQSYKQSLQYMWAASSQREYTRRSITQGVTGESILVDLPGFDRARSGAHDFMHLMDENIEQMLVKLWTGDISFESDPSTEPYFILQSVWLLIGSETKQATKTIPAYFCRLLPDIATERSQFIAETWAFWFTHLAPYLLEGRLPDPYYRHLLELVQIIKICMQLHIREDEINDLEVKIFAWVENYERLYYKFEIERLPACTSCIHAFLHVPYDIRQTGPVWVNWTYMMERFCGSLVAAVQSRRFPYAALSKRMLHKAQLSQIALKYQLPELLETQMLGETSSRERIYPEAPLSILRAPFRPDHHLDTSLRHKIAVHLTAECHKPVPLLLPLVPTSAEHWEKVRIAGGDHLRIATNRENINGRDQSYVRFDLSVDKYAKHKNKPSVFETKCFYGQLLDILVCELPGHEFFKKSPSRRLFALVRACETNEKDATRELVTYTAMSSYSQIIELGAISCVIGRVPIGTGNRWGIIDRSNDLMRPCFVDLDASETM